MKGDIPTKRSGAKETAINDDSFLIFGGCALNDIYSNELYLGNILLFGEVELYDSKFSVNEPK